MKAHRHIWGNYSAATNDIVCSICIRGKRDVLKEQAQGQRERRKMRKSVAQTDTTTAWQAALDLRSRLSNLGANNYGFVFETGDVSINGDNSPCFINLRENYSSACRTLSTPTRLMYLVDRCTRDSQSNKETLAYVKWLVQDSPFADCCLVKDAKEILKYGQIYDASYSAKMIVQAAITLRNSSEFKTKVKMWYELCKYCHPNVAFILCHMISKWDPIGWTVKVNFGGGHHAFDSCQFGKKEAERFIRDKYQKDDQSLRESQKFSPMNCTWGFKCTNLIHFNMKAPDKIRVKSMWNQQMNHFDGWSDLKKLVEQFVTVNLKEGRQWLR